MNYLRWVGFMRSLLIVGVLGAVVAPLSSEAAPASSPPTITLQLDSGTVVTINTTLSSTCVTGYNYCYTIPTGQVVTGTNGRQYRLDPNGTPRVRIADKNGLDKMSPTGFKLVPVGSWPNTEVHTLTLTVKHTFNATTDGPTGATINTANAGLTTWALRSAGEFNANSGSDPVNNKVTLTGTGIFSGSTSVNILSTSGTKNRSPLTFTIAGPLPRPTSTGAVSTTSTWEWKTQAIRNLTAVVPAQREHADRPSRKNWWPRSVALTH